MSAVSLLAAGSGVAFVIYGALCLFSASMRSEFARFGLERFRIVTGILEVLAGLGLLAGVRWPPMLRLSSGGVALLMLCVVVIRMSVGDGVMATLPALVLLLVNGYILWASLASV